MPDHTVLEELERLLGEATAGPWLQGTGGGGGATTYVYDATEAGRQKSTIAACTLDLVEHPFAEREANAALIAAMKNALPALLECARATVDWLTADESEDSEAYAAARERARQALAALEGVGR